MEEPVASITTDVQLGPRTTLGLGGPARHFVSAVSEEAVVAALRWAAERQLPVAVVGGGSNLVVADEGYPGLVLHAAPRGERFADDGRVHAMAGEPWDALVERTVARRLSGLECLSGIPGLVGATPIQNVGAYGQEVSQTLVSVRVVERATLATHELRAAECEFGYRDSLFKRRPDRFVVLGASFALEPEGRPIIRYAELERALGPDSGEPTLAAVRARVLELRRSKSMVIDAADENRRSAGSFFMNPVVDAAIADALVERALSEGLIPNAAAMPRFPAGPDRVKLAAGWLIEHAGFAKGMRSGPVGISTRHALCLVHHGGGTTAQLIAFARQIRDRVRDRFGVALTPEPTFLGFPPDFNF